MNHPELERHSADKLFIRLLSIESKHEQLPEGYTSIYCTIAPTGTDPCLQQLQEVIELNRKQATVAALLDKLDDIIPKESSNAALTVYCTHMPTKEYIAYRISYRQSGNKHIHYKIAKGIKRKDVNNVS